MNYDLLKGYRADNGFVPPPYKIHLSVITISPPPPTILPTRY